MLAILASFFICNPQRTKDIVPILDSYIQFVCLFVGEMMSTVLFQYITFYSTSLSTLLQIEIPLSEITLFGTLYNFHILSLNNLANLSTNVPSIVTTKCAILNNLLQTTRITFFSATNSNFVIKFTIKYVYSFSSTSFVINFSAGFSI